VKNNFTRFIILQKDKPVSMASPTKASLKITIKNQKGGLAKLLTVLSNNDLDLTKIQSIPVMSKPWEYSFFIDTLISDVEKFNQAMNLIASDFGSVKIFGTYQSRK